MKNAKEKNRKLTAGQRIAVRNIVILLVILLVALLCYVGYRRVAGRADSTGESVTPKFTQETVTVQNMPVRDESPQDVK